MNLPASSLIPVKAGMDPVPINVMIVDDHAMFRDGLRFLIERHPPFKVCAETDNAPEAISLAVQHAPAVAIVDISLRSTNGIELTKSLFARCPEIKVLVLSGMAEEVYAERALRAGARGFLVKHASVGDLTAALETIARGELYVNPPLNESGAPVGNNPREETIKLSDRELEVLTLLGNGLTTRATAEQLKLSVKTIDTYRDNLKRKLNLPNSDHLVHYAVQWAKTQATV